MYDDCYSVFALFLSLHSSHNREKLPAEQQLRNVSRQSHQEHIYVNTIINHFSRLVVKRIWDGKIWQCIRTECLKWIHVDTRITLNLLILSFSQQYCQRDMIWSIIYVRTLIGKTSKEHATTAQAVILGLKMTKILLITRQGICGWMARDSRGDAVEEILESDTGFAVQVLSWEIPMRNPKEIEKNIAQFEVKWQLDFTVITKVYYQLVVL